MATSFEEAAQHCDALVRSADKDRWLTALFVPEERRPLIHALYAFNAELARIRDQVSQPMLGEIRLQWWEDAVNGIYGGATPEPSGAAGAGPRHCGGRSATARFPQHDRGPQDRSL